MATNYDVLVEIEGGLRGSGGGSLEVRDDGSAVELNTDILDLVDGLSASSPSSGVVEAVLDATALKDGGSLEIDAAELSAGLGQADTALLSDGSAASWGKIPEAALGFDTATQTELGTHTADTDAHHTKTTSSEIDHDQTTNYDPTEHFTEGSISHQGIDQTTVSPDDHHTKYTDEEAQDAVGVLVSGSSILVYDDSGDALSIADGSVTNVKLSNDSVTVAGNVVALGGSTGIDHADLSAISPDDHHTKYTDEEAQDAAGALVSGSSILVYDDAGNALSISDGSVTNVKLSNDSVTIDAGAHLNGGGTAALGGSVTLDVDPSSIDISNLSGTLAGVPIKASGDNLTWALSPDDDLFLRNTTDSKELWEVDQDTGNITFPQFGGDPILFSHDHTDLGDPIPNSGLVNNSVTVTAGTDLVGGGQVSLGGSVTIDFDASSVAPDQLGGGDPFDIGSRSLSADGKSIFNFDGGPSNQGELNARYNGPYTRSDQFVVADTSSNPSLNGQIKRNGSDILAHSGGAIRNLSNIGSGGGAPTDASYLTLTAESGLSNEIVVGGFPFINSDYSDDSVDDRVIAPDSVGESELKSQVGGFEQITASGSYTASPGESVWADASSSSVPVTLPSPSKSDEVRVIARDTTNAVTLEESGSEGIQTPDGEVSTYTLVEDETIHVESNGTTWVVVGSLTSQLDSGQLGTLSTADDSSDFTISNVAGEETQGVAAVSVFPRGDINEDYAFNSVDWYRQWDESAGELDVVVTVNWDTKPSADLDLDYIVWKGAGGGGGGTTSTTGTAGGESVEVSSNYTGATWGQVVFVDTSSGDVDVELPSPSDTGEITIYKDDPANTMTISTPGSETIKEGSSAGNSQLSVTADGQSRTIKATSDTGDYRVI